MNTIEELMTFCRLQYQDCVIPVYYYQSNELIFSFPGQTSDTYPPLHYLAELSDSGRDVSCHVSDYGTYFGAIRVKDIADGMLILGPVSNVPYSDSIFRHMYADYVIPPENRSAFREFFRICPQMPLNSLLLKLIFLHYCLNHEVLTLTDITGVSHTLPVQKDTVENLYQSRELMLHNQSREIEAVYLDCIRTGNVTRLDNLAINEAAMHAGTLASTGLRQLKNLLIVTTTLATRAAIDGGLDADAAYQLSDYYIQTAEAASDSDTIHRLIGQINHDFAEKVARCRVPYTDDDILQKAIRYILQNVNAPIKASDVSDYVGFSRSYFSSYFREKLGFPISAFILRCKLEESRQLLEHTDKPLSVISSYLCFSSQSHFQTAFRKQFHVTPLQYRKSPALHSKEILKTDLN